MVGEVRLCRVPHPPQRRLPSRESRRALIYVNQVGGQDELIFDGGSFVLSADATLRAQLASWREEILPTTWRRVGVDWICEETKRTAPAEGLAAIYAAMVLGLRDYVHKNGFPGVIIGLSGGMK